MTVMPRTLLQLADASLKPASPQNTVLLMIDVQNEYVAGSLVLSGIDAALEQGRALLALARRHAVPVCHILHHGTPGRGPFDPHSRLGEPVDGFTPVEGEHVVIKSKPNAFTGTGLAAWLRRYYAPPRGRAIAEKDVEGGGARMAESIGPSDGTTMTG